MTKRHSNKDELCMVCQLPPESHSLDFNIAQLEVIMRFNEQTAMDNAT